MTAPGDIEVPQMDQNTKNVMRIVSVMEAEIWRRIEAYIRTQTPVVVMQTMMLLDAQAKYPWLSGREDELMKGLIEEKQRNPNIPYPQSLANVIKSMMPKESPTDAEK
jgi:hypothetical protein